MSLFCTADKFGWSSIRILIWALEVGPVAALTAHVQRDYALKHQLKKLVSRKPVQVALAIDAAPTTATGQMRWNSEVRRGKDRTGDITTCVSKVMN